MNVEIYRIKIRNVNKKKEGILADNIQIKNCNNIKEASIIIERQALNIKFGYNGTGKSTIGQAIMFQSSNNADELSSLTPYMSNDQPYVGAISFSKVMVFNETYVQNYLFKKEGIFEDSYRVLLRSKECENLAKQISNLLFELQNTFAAKDSIRDIYLMLGDYVTAVNYSDGNISKRGGIGEFINGNGAGFDKHNELQIYRPFYEGKSVSEVSGWASWRTKGIDLMTADDICPFCADKINMPELKKRNTTIKKVFKNSALKVAGQILDYLHKGISKGYIINDSEKNLEQYFGDSNKKDELVAELGKLGYETDYFLNKLQRIIDFRPMNVTQTELDNIDESLQNMQIDINQLNQFYATPAVKELTETINKKIAELLLNTGKLKGLFIQYQRKMDELISSRKDDINYFFALAGFPYNFDIKKDGENKASSFLTPVENQNERVNNPENHLSWGERNAFSLVMFMFDAVSEEADLIVLDDPISSFDTNKKYAVVKRMFSRTDVSFIGKTVLLLTHDLQPIIDYVHGDFLKIYNIPVYATYIENEKGVVKESRIEEKDLQNVVKLTKKLADDIKQPLHVRVVNLRKYIELTEPEYSDLDVYQVLSNLVHGRKNAMVKYSSGMKPMSKQQIANGMGRISNSIKEYNYEMLVDELDISILLDALNTENVYSKIIAIRLIFERQDGLMKKLRKEHPGASKFLNETNHIENDYIFQLDPSVFFTIPELYANEIKQFLDQNKDEIETTE